MLEALHTHPDFQGHGAGSMLVQWGTDLADSEKLPCLVESSPAGHRLYEKFGFEDAAELSIDLGKWSEVHGTYKQAVMVRPPKSAERLLRKE